MTETRKLTRQMYVSLMVSEMIQRYQAILKAIQTAKSAVELSGKLHGEKGLFNEMAGGTKEGRERVVQTELWQLATEKMRELQVVEVIEFKRRVEEIRKRDRKDQEITNNR